MDEQRAREIHQAIDQLRRNDFAPQPMMCELGLEILDGKLREIRHQQAVEIRVIDEIALDQIGQEVELRIGEQDRELRTRETLRGPRECFERIVVGQRFHRAIEPAFAFQLAHEAG